MAGIAVIWAGAIVPGLAEIAHRNIQSGAVTHGITQPQLGIATEVLGSGQTKTSDVAAGKGPQLWREEHTALQPHQRLGPGARKAALLGILAPRRALAIELGRHRQLGLHQANAAIGHEIELAGLTYGRLLIPQAVTQGQVIDAIG